ncbi:hypothetical protein [Pseudomonas fluorescens]|uniref:Uncharacterized protein n=1 Tax=Pseudomonas fluorescens TaxID=294 RepID=A0A5E7Q4J6_PSEFL|nr:hypothetical protein [Pseudomonas fluorescens]VVP57052.1 hypothetical protein PS880_05777 [Pseudomonas fluorescens]
MFYSASTGGFYDNPANYPNFPIDAVEITDELYAEVVSNKPIDKTIIPGADGLPELADPPPATTEQVEAARLQAYANPLTGSDRHFAEAARCNTAGDTAGAEAATAAGQVRYEEIRAELPWPEEAPTRKSKAKK